MFEARNWRYHHDCCNAPKTWLGPQDGGGKTRSLKCLLKDALRTLRASLSHNNPHICQYNHRCEIWKLRLDKSSRRCLRNNNLRSYAHQFWESPHQIKIALLQGTNWAIQFQMPLKNLMRNWKFKHKVSFTLKYLKISHTKCIPKVFIITVA